MSTLDLIWIIGGVISAPIIAGIVARLWWRDTGQMDALGVGLTAFAFVLAFVFWYVVAGFAVLYAAFRGFAYAVRPREFREPKSVKPQPDLEAEISRLERETGVGR